MLICTLTIAFFVPESFGPEQQEKLRLENLEKQRQRHERTGYPTTKMGRILDKCMEPLRLVRHLLPVPRPNGQGKNSRLFIIAISLLIASTVSGYNVTNVIVYANTKFEFDAAKVSSELVNPIKSQSSNAERIYDDHCVHRVINMASLDITSSSEANGTFLHANHKIPTHSN